MGRAPCCDKASVKKGPWSPEEDAKLKAYIDENGTGGNWIALPQKIGLKRCGKSCRLRWLNYLRPNIKHGDFTEEEEHIICRLYISIGSRWSIIAAQLPGRTDNDIKNYWNTKLKKKLLGKRAPSRRARAAANHDPYLAAAGGGGGANNMCTTSGAAVAHNAGGGATPQALSASALERIQLHMRLQGLYGAFGDASAAAAAPQWPKLEALLQTNKLLPAGSSMQTDAMATTTVGVQQQHMVDHQSLAGADEAAVEAEQQLGSGNYMAAAGSFERPSSKLGFYSPSGEVAEAASAEMSPCPMATGVYGGGGGFGPHHDELYDFLYSKYASLGGGVVAHGGGHIPPLPELQHCPDGGTAASAVGGDEKFSTWTATASCEYDGGHHHQLQGTNSVGGSLQDYVLGGYGQ